MPPSHYFKTFSLIHCFLFVLQCGYLTCLVHLILRQIKQLYLTNRILLNWKDSGVFLCISLHSCIYMNHKVSQEVTFTLFFTRITRCFFPLTSNFLNNCFSMKTLGVIKYLIYRTRDFTCDTVSCSKYYLYCLFSVKSSVILRCQFSL